MVTALVASRIDSLYQPLQKKKPNLTVSHLSSSLSLLCPFRKAVVQHLIHAFQRSSGSAMVKTFRVNYKRHVLTMDDLGTLYGQNWLNDQVHVWLLKILLSLALFGSIIFLLVRQDHFRS